MLPGVRNLFCACLDISSNVVVGLSCSINEVRKLGTSSSAVGIRKGNKAFIKSCVVVAFVEVFYCREEGVAVSLV
jgi:hypothetical protein